MTISWQFILMTAAATQLLGVLSYCALSRRTFPKSGLRGAERLLLASAMVVAASSLALVDVSALWRPRAKVVSASAKRFDSS